MKLTVLLIILCLIGFVAAVFNPGVYDVYGFSQNNFVANPFVIVTSIFLHGSVEHILSNILVLLFFGLAVEGELGWRKATVIFFLGSFAGDLLSMMVYAPSEIAVGASAGIFALIGVGMLVRPMDLSFYPLMIPLPLAVLGLGYALYNVYGFIAGIDPGVSYIAHFGGLFVGLAFGFKNKGWKKGLRTLAITFIVMIIIPLLWMLFKG